MKTFASAVNCMDGPVQEPVIEFLRSNYQVDFVDMITESGPDRIMAEETDKLKINSIRQRLEVSVRKHDSRIILVAGHANCSGNPDTKDIHIAQILNASATIRKWFPEAEIVPVWIGEDLQVEPL